MKESLSQSVILAQETAEKVKASAADESANLINRLTSMLLIWLKK